MTRKISLPAFVLFVASAVCLPGCTGGSGDAEFEETAAPTAEEEAAAEDYMESYEQDMQRMQQQGN